MVAELAVFMRAYERRTCVVCEPDVHCSGTAALVLQCGGVDTVETYGGLSVASSIVLFASSRFVGFHGMGMGLDEIGWDGMG